MLSSFVNTSKYEPYRIAPSTLARAASCVVISASLDSSEAAAAAALVAAILLATNARFLAVAPFPPRSSS